MTNNNFNSNDFSNGCEGLENGSEQTFDKMAESVDKANVEGISSSIEENRFDEQAKETTSKDNTNFSLPTTLKDYLIFSRNFYSGFWVRFIAYIIDLIVVAALACLLNTYSFGLNSFLSSLIKLIRSSSVPILSINLFSTAWVPV